MKSLIIKVGDKTYNVEVAITKEDKENGLQEIKNLPEDKGMLFDFEEPQKVSFWMKDTLIPLDIIFINEDGYVIQVSTGIPNDETGIVCDKVLYVLEVNSNSGIKVGDELDFEFDKMRVLTKEGNTQMLLDGGERIFSRKNTVSLIKLAKRADISERDSDYKKLGKKIFEFINKQDSNKTEYVQKKD